MTNSIGPGSVFTNIGSGVTVLTDNTVSIGETYTYYIVATNYLGNSTIASDTVVVLPHPPGSDQPVFENNLGMVRIAPTTVFQDEKLYFDKVTEDAEITIYDIKGRKIWTKKVTECSKEGKYFYIDDNVMKDLVDGLYMAVFSNNKEDPNVKKFNKIKKKKQ